MRRQAWLVLVFAPLLLPAASRTVEAAAGEEAVYQGKTLAEWIGDLKDPAADQRAAAAQAVAVFGPKREVVAALAAALRDGNNAVLVYAAQALGRFGPKAKDALPALHAAFKRNDAALHQFVGNGPLLPSQTIAEALIRIEEHPGADFAPIFAEALRSGDAEQRRDLMIRMGKLGAKAARVTVPVLIDALKDQHAKVRLEAVKALGCIGPAAKPAIHALTLALKKAAPQKTPEAVQMEVSARPPGTPGAEIQHLSFTIVTGDQTMLQACAEALGRIRPGTRGAVAALRVALRDLDEGVRWAALCALANNVRDARDLTPVLIPVLRDKEAVLRRIAVEALGKCGSAVNEVSPLLTTALKDADASVREAAANALNDKRYRVTRATPALIGALHDTEAKVRAAAAESLGTIGASPREVVPALIAALRDKEGTVPARSGAALAKFGPQARSAFPTLLTLLRDPSPDKRTVACYSLFCFGPVARETIPILAKLAESDPEEAVRLLAHTALARIDSARLKESVRRLTTALRSTNREVRGAAVECLGLLGPEAREALSALNTLRKTDSGDLHMRMGIAEAIKLIEAPPKKSRDE